MQQPSSPIGLAHRLNAALAWRLRRLFGDARVDRVWVQLAQWWRPLLRKPVFVGITGSAGKTTAKELLVGILQANGLHGTGNPASLNVLPEVAKTVMRVRPYHDFCVTEVSGHRPGQLDRPLVLLQPRIGIVTAVGNDHWSAYDSREAIAREKGKLPAALGSNGTAVLNADDPLVRAMRERCRGKVIAVGMSEHADMRAFNVRAAWPQRLAFDLQHAGSQVTVQTQLCGAHWLPAALGALGGALAFGLSLEQCAKSMAKVPAFEGRMQSVETPEGISFVRDDFKAPLWTVDACLDFLAQAQAARKILVIGMLSDGGAQSGHKYARLAKRAQEVADITIFVGPWSSHVLKTRADGAPDALQVFSRVYDVAMFLKRIARSGDLVLIKGTNKQDHLSRIIHARTDDVACWRDECQLDRFCRECPSRMVPSGIARATASPAQALAVPTMQANAASLQPLAPDEYLIVGLGNADTRYQDTPHNIGFDVVDRLAARLGCQWQELPSAWVAHGTHAGRPLRLVKLRTTMNETGARLKQYAGQLALAPARCIVVFDDVALPLGTVRTRLRGGAGGHRGVVSILEAFQTDEFARVKVGVGPATAAPSLIDYVLKPFGAELAPAAAQAADMAAERTLLLLNQQNASIARRVA